MAALIAPAQRRLGEQSGVGSALADRIVSLELGAVLGLLSRRVLGQYELVLPTADGGPGDTVMLVGANLLAMERQHEFRPAEFRFWVALHECTHRAQFIGVPWLREYFLSLVGELVDTAVPESGRLQRIAAEMRRASAAGEPLIDDTGLFGLFASAEQRQVIDKVQALMSLLEGHGHVVMDRIGARTLVTQRRMSSVLRTRRQDPRTARFLRLIGMEMKLKQYDAGAAFIRAVERQSGFDTLDRAWAGPEMIPTHHRDRRAGTLAGAGGVTGAGAAIPDGAAPDLIPEGPVVVALSGGADSAVAAWLALTRSGDVTAVFVDHGWPASSVMADGSGRSRHPGSASHSRS